MKHTGTASPKGNGSVERAIAAIRRGSTVVVVDDADRENEGDLIFAAEHATTTLLAFVIRHTSGFVCTALPAEDCARLDLPPMHHGGSGDRFGTGYRVSVDLVGQGTGISAADRAGTIAALAAPTARPADFTRPGHVIPLAARDGGVLTRRGHTEAAVDLARLAGLRPAGGLCEIVSTDRPTEMARGAELERFAAEHDLEIISIEDLVDYRRRTEPQVRRHAVAALPTLHGEFRVVGYRGTHDDAEYVAMVAGDVRGEGVPVFVHTECLTGDALGSLACGCRDLFQHSLARVGEEGRGVVVYVRQVGRPPACGLLTVPVDQDSERTDTVVSSIMVDLKAVPLWPIRAGKTKCSDGVPATAPRSEALAGRTSA